MKCPACGHEWEATRKGLTKRQNDLLHILQQREHAGNSTPTYQELSDMLGLRSKSGVARLVDGLAARGLVTKLRYRPQSVRTIG